MNQSRPYQPSMCCEWCVFGSGECTCRRSSTVEQLPRKQSVVGSTPTGGSTLLDISVHSQDTPIRVLDIKTGLIFCCGQEDDGRHFALVWSMPGVMAYGATQQEAVDATRALAAEVAAEEREESPGSSTGRAAVSKAVDPGSTPTGGSTERVTLVPAIESLIAEVAATWKRVIVHLPESPETANNYIGHIVHWRYPDGKEGHSDRAFDESMAMCYVEAGIKEQNGCEYWIEKA